MEGGRPVVKETSDAEQTARSYVEMWSNGEYSKALEPVSESFVIRDPAAPGGEVRGPDGLEEFVRGVRAGFPDLQAEVLDVLSDGELVTCETRLSGTHEGEFDGVPPTAREAEIRAMEKSRIAVGSVREHRVYFDRRELFEQLGVKGD